MANITVQRQNGNRIHMPQSTEWEPARMIRNLLNWDPFREMVPFVAEERYAFAPAFEVKETKEGYLFKADVPGVKEGDLQVTLTGTRLTVSGKRETEKEEQTDTYYTCERSYGSFTRSFTLPEGVETQMVHADLRDGVLIVHVAKKPEMQPKKIAITGASAPKS